MGETSKWFLSVMLLSFVIVLALIGNNNSKIDDSENLPNYSEHDLNCMTNAIYYEAGNQSELGKQAVAKVVMNRVNTGKFANSVCDVITQSKVVGQTKVCQFSFFCEKAKMLNEKIWFESRLIAENALQNKFDGAIIESLNDALYFHAWYVKPYWAKKMKKLAVIEDHIFYGEKHERKTN